MKVEAEWQLVRQVAEVEAEWQLVRQVVEVEAEWQLVRQVVEVEAECQAVELATEVKSLLTGALPAKDRLLVLVAVLKSEIKRLKPRMATTKGTLREVQELELRGVPAFLQQKVQVLEFRTVPLVQEHQCCVPVVWLPLPVRY